MDKNKVIAITVHTYSGLSGGEPILWEPGCGWHSPLERVSGGSWEEIDSSPKLPWRLILPENSRQNWRLI